MTIFILQVGKEFTSRIDLDRNNWLAPDYFPITCDALPTPPSHRGAIINAFVYVHQTLHKANAKLAKRGSTVMAITPRYAPLPISLYPVNIVCPQGQLLCGMWWVAEFLCFRCFDSRCLFYTLLCWNYK